MINYSHVCVGPCSYSVCLAPGHISVLRLVKVSCLLKFFTWLLPLLQFQPQSALCTRIRRQVHAISNASDWVGLWSDACKSWIFLCCMCNLLHLEINILARVWNFPFSQAPCSLHIKWCLWSIPNYLTTISPNHGFISSQNLSIFSLTTILFHQRIWHYVNVRQVSSERDMCFLFGVCLDYYKVT